MLTFRVGREKKRETLEVKGRSKTGLKVGAQEIMRFIFWLNASGLCFSSIPGAEGEEVGGCHGELQQAL